MTRASLLLFIFLAWPQNPAVRRVLLLALTVGAFVAAPESRAGSLSGDYTLEASLLDARQREHTVRVAAPTGELEIDRASILAALEQARPRATVQFAAGRYLIGSIISVPTDEITLLGHPDGTVIRGCAPDAFPDYPAALFACHGFELTGARQTVRNLTFEYTWHGLFVGCCFPEDEEAMEAGDTGQRHQPGGHLIEGNTFKYSPNGLRVIGELEEDVVVRRNRFIDVYHAIGINGGTVHFLDNDISVSEPERVPISTHPGGAIGVSPFGQGPDRTSCIGNVVAGNRIEGHPEAIGIKVYGPGESCRHNVIRDNTIAVQRVSFIRPWFGIRFSDEDDHTLVGYPIVLLNIPATTGEAVEAGQEPLIEDNVIEGNRILGAEGLGIMVQHASRNRIAGNTIAGIRPRDPFPGNDLHIGMSPQWEVANGAGIWISPGSDGNEIAGNTFEDVASYAVFLEGDNNRVELRSAGDTVRDLGTGNRISGPTGSAGAVAPPLYESTFVDARGIRLQYMDFGGSGLPVIFVQDFHDYFSLEEEPQHAAWLSRFADDFRVLAPVRRGYGESDDTGWGYDVATQSRDLLGVMDALGIRRAVLVGRNAATQDMTWIAEHHPERLAGLVYLENPLVFPDYRDPLVRTYAEMYWRGTCDLGAGDDAIARTGPRAPWRPHFLYDDAVRIDIPALRFFAPRIESRSVDLRRLDRLARIAASDHCGDQVARDFFTALATDEERVAAIRQVLTEGDLSLAVHRATGRAFGTNLRTVTMEGDFAGREAIRAFRDPHVRSFLEDVALREAARQPAPDSQRRE
jgi:parallel beta-helix repeat protein